MASQTAVWAQSMLGQTLKQQYRLDGVLGEGAMGVVFGGVNLAMDKPVAIKMMRKEAFDTPDAVERFNREARVWSQLNHPVIPQVFDFGLHEGQPFLVMEIVEGSDVSEVLKREGTLEPLRAVRLIRQLAGALEEAHRLGVVHRDIKPANLKLLRYQPGGKIVLKVLDFGMAKQVDRVDQRLTAPGMLVGTPKYVAPEQIQEKPVIDGRADLYATGVVFYELLSGQAPFLGNPHEVLLAHLGKEPAPLPDAVPPMVQDVVMRLLRKRADERFQSAAALEQALEECEVALRAPALQPYSSGLYQAVGMSGAGFAPVKQSSSSTPGPITPSAKSLRSIGAALAAQAPSVATPVPPSASSGRGQSAPSARSRSGPSQPAIAAVPTSSPGHSSSGQNPPVPAPMSPPSARFTHSEPSQPIASQIGAPPQRGMSRTLLGTVFLFTMVGSAGLFYGLRHYLPLQRTVASFIPSFRVPQDDEVNLALRAMEVERDKRQWPAVLRGALFLEQRYGATLLPEQSTSLAELRKHALAEQPMQETYEKLLAASSRPDPEEVMRLYGQIADTSTYKALARRDYEAAVESYVATHLSRAEELRLAAQCAEFLSEVQKLLSVLPGHALAQAAGQRPCPPIPATPDPQAPQPMPQGAAPEATPKAR